MIVNASRVTKFNVIEKCKLSLILSTARSDFLWDFFNEGPAVNTIVVIYDELPAFGTRGEVWGRGRVKFSVFAESFTGLQLVETVTTPKLLLYSVVG